MRKSEDRPALTTDEAELLAAANGRIAELEAELEGIRASLHEAIRQASEYATKYGYWKGKAEGFEALNMQLKADLKFLNTQGRNG